MKGGVLAGVSETVKVTIQPRDYLFYPVVVLSLSVFAAWWVKRWAGFERILKLVDLDLERAKKEMRTAEGMVDQIGDLAGLGRFGIESAFDGELARIQTLVTRVRKGGGKLDAANAAYGELMDHVRLVANAGVLWTGFGRSVRQMAADTREVRRIAKPVDEKLLSERPVVEERARELLTEKLELELTEIGPRALLMDGMARQLETWLRAWATTERMMGAAGGSKEIEEQVRTARATLWAADGETSLTAAIRMVEQAKAKVIDSSGHEIAGREGLTAPIEVPVAVDVRPSPAGPSVALQDGDQLAFLISLLLAVVTGLNQFYFANSFGSLSDYSKLTAWGLGTKLAVDVALAGIGRLFPAGNAGSAVGGVTRY